MSLIVLFPVVMLSITAIITLLVCVLIIFDKFNFLYTLNKQGWGIKNWKRESFYYVEKIGNKHKELKFNCKQIDYILSEVTLLSEEEWAEKTPGWAKHKRNILLKD